MPTGSTIRHARSGFHPRRCLVPLNAAQPGDTVADIGAGTGYFSLPIAEAVGPEGKVYAVDAQAEMLSLPEAEDRSGRHTGTSSLVHATAEKTGLPSSSCDLYLLANVWHELDDCDAAVREARRALKPGGNVAILDWRPDVEPEHGPPLAHRLSTLPRHGAPAGSGLRCDFSYATSASTRGLFKRSRDHDNAQELNASGPF